VSSVQLDDNIRIDGWKRKGLSRRRKLENVGAETTSVCVSKPQRGWLDQFGGLILVTSFNNLNEHHKSSWHCQEFTYYRFQHFNRTTTVSFTKAKSLETHYSCNW